MTDSHASRVGIYCSGGIKKGPEDAQKLVWGEAERLAVGAALDPHEPVFLNPDDRSDDLTDAFTVFGRDHFQVRLSDFVVVDARQRRGIGVGIEMLSAKRFRKPLVSVVPREGHYRRARIEYLGGEVDDYVHAHLFGLSDAIVDDFAEAGAWIRDFLDHPKTVKDISVLDQAIAAYEERQMARDLPMKEAFDRLQARS